MENLTAKKERSPLMYDIRLTDIQGKIHNTHIDLSNKEDIEKLKKLNLSLPSSILDHKYFQETGFLSINEIIPVYEVTDNDMFDFCVQLEALTKALYDINEYNSSLGNSEDVFTILNLLDVINKHLQDMYKKLENHVSFLMNTKAGRGRQS